MSAHLLTHTISSSTNHLVDLSHQPHLTSSMLHSLITTLCLTHQAQHIQALYLDFCPITTLPESITQLSSLHTLHLNHTPLSNLPHFLTTMTHLHTLSIEYTPITPKALNHFRQSLIIAHHLSLYIHCSNDPLDHISIS